MPLTLVVAGQYGGEGKGQVTASLARFDRADVLVKTGGPNSAHSYGTEGRIHRVRMVPSGASLGPSMLVYPAGCLIDPATLFAELEEVDFRGSVVIDRQAGVIEEKHERAQSEDPFYQRVGSTLRGTGAAAAERARRRLRLAGEEPSLREFLGDASAVLQEKLLGGEVVIAEGSQAFGLSNYHGDWPYVTSRDTTTGAFLSQLGLGPRWLDRVVLVVKCFPTRNAHGSGALPGELPAGFLEAHLEHLAEKGGGAGGERQRRVALFDFEILERAVLANSPDWLAVTGLDKLAALLQEPVVSRHYGSVEDFLAKLEARSGVPVGLESWGASVEQAVDRRRPALRAPRSVHAAPAERERELA